MSRSRLAYYDEKYTTQGVTHHRIGLKGRSTIPSVTALYRMEQEKDDVKQRIGYYDQDLKHYNRMKEEGPPSFLPEYDIETHNKNTHNQIAYAQNQRDYWAKYLDDLDNNMYMLANDPEQRKEKKKTNKFEVDYKNYRINKIKEAGKRIKNNIAFDKLKYHPDFPQAKKAKREFEQKTKRQTFANSKRNPKTDVNNNNNNNNNA